MDEALLLARVQFGLNIGFHILFPTITIGLGWMLAVFRLRHERTRDPAWLTTYKLWVKVFALTFAMGVVTGIVMSFQFGTNWPGFMNRVGPGCGSGIGWKGPIPVHSSGRWRSSCCRSPASRTASSPTS